ncbi:ABC transporter permease [Paenibacillus daejeonensis]|uniref:ABC transporter permease n=1 Tax=Paenibacillus daejeonensis TaxID=135193 RepID=UPI00036932D4|nr:ABC transporter permease [Paenibacillus daejeonensis]
MGDKLRFAGPPLAVLFLLLLIWQGAVWLFELESWKLPGPVEIVREAWTIGPRLMEHTWATAQLAIIGFAAGAATGMLVAALLHLIPGARAALYPLLVLSQNIPTIVLYPLLMIWLGLGLLPKLVLIILVCFFPIAVAMLSGLSQRDPRLADYLAMIGAGKWRIFRDLELPGAVPYLFSGLKIAAAYSITGVIVAEWLGASRGIGYFIKLSYSGFLVTRVFAGVAIIVLLSLIVFGIIVAIERWFTRWQPRKEGK